jgi:sugar phosphate isomerase/epimerase
MFPYQSEAVWQKQIANLRSRTYFSAQNNIPITAVSHWFNNPPYKGLHFGQVAVGPDIDFEQMEFFTRRALKRCADLGVKVAGVYGAGFPMPEGYTKKKAMDEAIRYVAMAAKYAEQYNVIVALDPNSDTTTLIPKYVDAVALAKESGSKFVGVMVAIKYLLRLDQRFEDIAKDPSYCAHCSIQGDGVQPNIGDFEKPVLKLFSIFRDIGYQGGVSVANQWKSTSGEILNLKLETGITLEWMKKVRDKAYKG